MIIVYDLLDQYDKTREQKSNNQLNPENRKKISHSEAKYFTENRFPNSKRTNDLRQIVANNEEADA